MKTNNKIDIDIFKIVTKAIAESDNLVIMANSLTQLLVGALGIKGCTIFALNPDEKEFEVLASFGLSAHFLNKGPVLCNNSISATLRGEPVVVSDISTSDQLQYRKDTLAEGVQAIISVPINFAGEMQGAVRLYHSETWEISEQDLDSLLILAENIGLAMSYTKLLNTVETVRDVICGKYMM
jgi:GAF domain-containing protein